MRYFKINNLKNMFGQCDYKGLDIDKFVPGSQGYSSDVTYCIIATNEESIISNTDLLELTEAQYIAEMQIIKNTQQENDPIKQLQQQNAAILLALVNGGLL